MIHVVLTLFVCVAIPNGLLVGAFSAIGVAHVIYNLVADATINMVANGVAAVVAFWLALLFIFDYQRRTPWVQVPLGIVTLVLFFCTGILKGIYYPSGMTLLCVCTSVILIGYARLQIFKEADGITPRSFYGAAAISYGMGAIVVLFVWLLWVFLGDAGWNDNTLHWLERRNADVYTFLLEEIPMLNGSIPCRGGANASMNLTALLDAKLVTKVQGQCMRAERVCFLQWSAPFVLFTANSLSAGFCFLFARTRAMRMSFADEIDEHSKQRLQKMLKFFVLVIALTVASMYSALYVSGASVSLGSAILALAGSLLAGLLGWVYFEVDHELLKRVAAEAPLAHNILNILKSDWMRAIAVGGTNIFIPLLAVMDMARQKVRRDSEDKFTKRGRMVYNELSSWNWCSIFGKVDLLGILFVVMLVGMKATFVVFSMLNETIAAAQLGIWVVVGFVFLIGVLMFMLPIVPGSAVYLFAGVVIGAQADSPDSMGFWPGVVVASIAGSLAKLLACCGQYGLGYVAGKSVSVQKFVGVDQVTTRAMEKILKNPGMGLGKVCILVAGPDFPVSMLCGILCLNIPQMLLGTAPVILVSIVPQTLVGALLTKQGNVWRMISTAATGIAAAFQAGATLYFTFRIMKTVERDGEELAKYREEHKAVAELTKARAAYEEIYKEVTTWHKMSAAKQFVCMSAAICFLISGFALAADMMLEEKFIFRKFAITDSVYLPYELNGLQGSPWALVIAPLGWVPLGLAFFAFLVHWGFGKWMSAIAHKKLRKGVRQMNGDATTEAPPDTVGRPA